MMMMIMMMMMMMMVDIDDNKGKDITYYPEACQPHLSKVQFKSMHIENIKSNQIKPYVIKS